MKILAIVFAALIATVSFADHHDEKAHDAAKDTTTMKTDTTKVDAAGNKEVATTTTSKKKVKGKAPAPKTEEAPAHPHN